MRSVAPATRSTSSTAPAGKTIDLVEIEERCKPGDDDVCGTISVLDAGAWREVGRTTPV